MERPLIEDRGLLSSGQDVLIKDGLLFDIHCCLRVITSCLYLGGLDFKPSCAYLPGSQDFCEVVAIFE